MKKTILLLLLVVVAVSGLFAGDLNGTLTFSPWAMGQVRNDYSNDYVTGFYGFGLGAECQYIFNGGFGVGLALETVAFPGDYEVEVDGLTQTESDIHQATLWLLFSYAFRNYKQWYPYIQLGYVPSVETHFLTKTGKNVYMVGLRPEVGIKCELSEFFRLTVGAVGNAYFPIRNGNGLKQWYVETKVGLGLEF